MPAQLRENTTLSYFRIVGIVEFKHSNFFCFEIAIRTLVLNLKFSVSVEDSERNDGSPSKPYFMSKNLMKILHKKNKIE